MRLLSLTDVLDRAREVAREVAAPGAADVDLNARWPADTLRALQTAGLGGLVVPRPDGGLGHGMSALTQVCEILAGACSSSALCFGMHCVGAAALSARATEPQRARYLTPIIEGAHLTTLALSEPGTGSHFYLPETRLDPAVDGGFRVNGTKSFITSGGMADSYVLSTVTTTPGAPIGEFSLIVVPGDAPGLEWHEPWGGLGMRGNSSRTVSLRDVPLPPEALLGETGDQIWYVFNVVAPYFLAAMAGTYLGIAAAAVAETRDHLSRRTHSHSHATLARQSLLQHRFGSMWGAVESVRRLIYHAAAAGDAGADDALPAILSAKAEVADCVVTVVNEAMTLAGGIAYRENSLLARLLRDARAAHVMAPTTDLLRVWTGRALLGLPLLGE